MADDIDALLDEIEKTYIDQVDTKTKSKGNQKNLDGDEEFSDILRDTSFIRPTGSLGTPSVSVRPSDVNQHNEIRCYPVFIGGCDVPFGLSLNGNKRSCSQLRCLSCDFNVSSFEHYKWSSDTDYLFLRNHMPDFEKLSSNLIKQKGTRAYACQCSWKNVLELTDIRSTVDLKWICAKHSDHRNSS